MEILNPNISSENIRPIKASMLSDEFTPPLSLRSLVLNGKECISTFENPNLEPWQRVGINRCTLDETFIADIKRLWAIMPELRAAMVLLPIE
ncbi:hypothetical protein [Campylobacter vicugnae]|uniref:hypothetical protein n=1 Tax=Campylobacter vicugnae TaxID=1660076 RepID=UPI000A34B3BB|nr:hypothetical protein [Campylobacter sp. RM8970]